MVKLFDGSSLKRFWKAVTPNLKNNGSTSVTFLQGCDVTGSRAQSVANCRA
jgi:hypothetical protein